MSAGFARPDRPLQEMLELDFGRHVSGCAELAVHGEPGDWVCLFGLDWHRLRGGPGETVRMRFAHRAFRYVPVYLYGRKRAPRIESERALGIQNDIPSTGRFSSADPTLNQIHDAAARTWKTLMLSGMPMDSWQERFGTTLVQNLEPSLYWQSLGAFYTKWMDDHADAQRPDGFIPTSGGPMGQDYWSAAAAQVAPLLVPWLMWRFYGDLDIVRRCYPIAREWLRFAEPPDNDLDETWKPPAEHGQSELCIGDHGRYTARWYEPRWGDLVETLFIIQFFQAAQELATLLGEDEDAARYAGFIERLQAKVNRTEFFDAAQGIYADHDQGCHATALWTGVVPEEARGRVEAELFRDILESRQGHMNTGFVGTWFLLKLLDRLNRPEVAYQIITADDPPSWKTLLHHPSSPERLTMLTEFFTGGMVPHPGWCSVGLWFYQSLAGIHPDPAGPGFKRIRIRPRIVPGLPWAEGEYDSLRGTIRSRWEQDDERIAVSVTVPPNTSASIEIPAQARSAVRESGDVTGIVQAEMSGGRLAYQVEPGSYRFEIPLSVYAESTGRTPGHAALRQGQEPAQRLRRQR
jgi:alpha-L-rhamnosidase